MLLTNHTYTRPESLNFLLVGIKKYYATLFITQGGRPHMSKLALVDYSNHILTHLNCNWIKYVMNRNKKRKQQKLFLSIWKNVEMSEAFFSRKVAKSGTDKTFFLWGIILSSRTRWNFRPRNHWLLCVIIGKFLIHLKITFLYLSAWVEGKGFHWWMRGFRGVEGLICKLCKINSRSFAFLHKIWGH